MVVTKSKSGRNRIMTKFNTVKRKANVGERILITDATVTGGQYKNGDLFTVFKSAEESTEKSEHVEVKEHDWPILTKEYEVVIENKAEAIGMEKVKSLKEIVSSLVDCGYTCEAGSLENNVDFRLLTQIAGFSGKPATLHKGETVVTASKFANAPRVKSLQEIRDDIIEQAKRDVAELVDRGRNGSLYGDTSEGNETYRTHFYFVDFEVNSEKRTVVALIRRGRLNAFKRVEHRGIAKCAPTDCFNAHLGKAIALRRALGLEVPAKYLNVPQPTEVRNYDKVLIPNGKVLTVTPGEDYDPRIKGTQCQAHSPNARKGQIIDDTRDGANE